MLAAIKRGLERIRELGRKDEAEPRAGAEAQLKSILEAYHRELTEHENPTSRGVWIFQGEVDHEAFLQACVAVAEDELMAGRREGARAVDEFEGWDCACRCREHQRVACPTCLEVERCPVHGDDDPARVSPKWRERHQR